MSLYFLTDIAQTGPKHWGIDDMDWRGFIPERFASQKESWFKPREDIRLYPVSDYTLSESLCLRDV